MAALQCELCGGKLQGKPGGIFQCDSCGMEYTTEWAKAKIQEIKGTVKVEGTVEVTGTVKVEGAANIDGILARGFADCEDGNFNQAKDTFREALKIDPENSEGHIGLAMCQVKCRKWSEYWAGLASKKYEEDNNFQRAVSGKGSQRFQDVLHTYQAHIQAKEAEKNEAITRGAEKTSYYAQLREKYAPVRKLCGSDYFVKPDGTLGAFYDSMLRHVDVDDPELRNLVAVYFDRYFLFLGRADGTVLLVDLRYDLNGRQNPDYRKVRILLTPDQKVTSIAVAYRRKVGYYCAVLHENGNVSYWTLGASLHQKAFDDPSLWTNVKQIREYSGYFYALKEDGSILRFNLDSEKTKVMDNAGGDVAEAFLDTTYNDPVAYLQNNGLVRLVGLGRSRYKGIGGLIPETWTDIIQIKVATSEILGLTASGTLLLAESDRFKWWKNAVEELAAIKNVVALNDSRAICKDGSVISLSFQGCKSEKVKLFRNVEELNARIVSFAEKEREIIRHRNEKKAELQTEKTALLNELANLKGLFTGKRRKEIETRLAQIAVELENLR